MALEGKQRLAELLGVEQGGTHVGMERPRAWPAVCQAQAFAPLGQASDVQQSIPGHTEDEARAVLGEVRLRLVKPGLHRDGAFLPMQAALHRVGDVHLKVALLTLEMIHQDSNKFSDPTLMGWLFAEEADNEVFVVFCMEHYKLVLSIGDTQASQIVQWDGLHHLVVLSGVHFIEVTVSDKNCSVFYLTKSIHLSDMTGKENIHIFVLAFQLISNWDESA